MSRPRVVSSLRGIRPNQKKIILAEAQGLNGNLKSLNGFSLLRGIIEKKCGISVNDVILRRILARQGKELAQRGKEPSKVRPPKRKWAGIRPSPGRMRSK